MSDQAVVRFATTEDLEAINAIYNEAVLTTISTFDTEIKSIDFRKNWFHHRLNEKHSVLVCEDNGIVKGWASLNQYSDRAAYDGTVENSVYVAETDRSKGYGTLLMKMLVEQAKLNGLHTILARIADSNMTSIRLHEKYGFKKIGIMREVGYKFGRWVDVQMMQLML